MKNVLNEFQRRFEPSSKNLLWLKFVECRNHLKDARTDQI